MHIGTAATAASEPLGGVSSPSVIPLQHAIKFTDDATIMGCIPVNNDTGNQLTTLTSWCNANNHLVHLSKNTEMIVDPLRPDISPWSRHMDAIESVAPETRILMNFYTCTIDRMLAETSGTRTEAIISSLATVLLNILIYSCIFILHLVKFCSLYVSLLPLNFS